MDPLYDIENERELNWEDDFPFEPKTVSVILVPTDYDNISTAPASIGNGYVIMAQIANQIAKFIRGLGYHAFGAGNDLGMSMPYAIAAGLGEGGRNQQLLAPGIGPRHRICKFYNDFEDVEYDLPHNWGIAEFCLSCGKCAEACPPGAGVQWYLLPLSLVGSFFILNFWCRLFCPVGLVLNESVRLWRSLLQRITSRVRPSPEVEAASPNDKGDLWRIEES